MSWTEIDSIRSSARVEEARDRMHSAMAKAIDKLPWLLKHDRLNNEELQEQIDNCVKYECYVGANYLTEVLQKRDI